MKFSNIKKAIAKVEDAESNIEALSNLLDEHQRNITHNKNNAKIGFYVCGTVTEFRATSVDDVLMAELINAMLKRAIELGTKDKQVIEALEMMMNPDTQDKPKMSAPPFIAQQAPVAPSSIPTHR